MYEWYANYRRMSSMPDKWRNFPGARLEEDHKYWTSLNLPVYLHRQQIWIRKKR